MAASLKKSLDNIYFDYLGHAAEHSPDRPVAAKQTRRGLRQGIELAEETADAWTRLREAWIQTPERIWAWSDLHLAHANIIKYCSRPFYDTKGMHDGLQQGASNVVKPEDYLLCLGDVAMWKQREAITDWVQQIPGHKFLIFGNHDVRGSAAPKTVDDWRAVGFEGVAATLDLPIDNAEVRNLWLTHYPLAEELIPENVLNIHGHTHQIPISGRHRSACLEIIGYAPRRLSEIVMGQSIVVEPVSLPDPT